MKYLYPSFILLAFLICLPSCCPSTSVHPLSPIDQATYDLRLEGNWIHRSESGGTGYLHVGKTRSNLMKAVAAEIKNNGELDYAVFTFFPTTIDHQQYLNIKADEVFKDLTEPTGYILARYTVSDSGILHIYYMDTQQFARAVISKKLQGVVTYAKKVTFKTGGNDSQEENKRIDCVQLTDTSEKIRNFIKTNSPDVLFPGGVQLVKEKIK